MWCFALIQIIAAELRRCWPILVLGLGLFVSAIWVVLTAHQARLLTVEHHHSLQLRDQLDVEWRHLLLEEQTWAEHSRIEAFAMHELDMARPAASKQKMVLVP